MKLIESGKLNSTKLVPCLYYRWKAIDDNRNQNKTFDEFYTAFTHRHCLSGWFKKELKKRREERKIVPTIKFCCSVCWNRARDGHFSKENKTQQKNLNDINRCDERVKRVDR